MEGMESLRKCYLDGFIERRRGMTDEDVIIYWNRAFDIVGEAYRVEGYQDGVTDMEIMLLELKNLEG